MFVSAKYTRDTMPDDAMYVWLENVNSRSFEVCIREFLPFDGKHQDTTVVRDIPTIILVFRSGSANVSFFYNLILRPMGTYAVNFLLQDWFAFVGNGSGFSFTLSGEADFPNSSPPTAEDNYGFCQVSVIYCHLLFV